MKKVEVKEKKEFVFARSNNAEVDYFIETEQMLTEALLLLRQASTYLLGCSYRDTFGSYVRRQQIEELWQKIKEEINGI